MRPFFELPAAQWDRLSGKLHLYVIPPEPARELAARYHDVMRAYGELVSLQPLEQLHMTVQMIEAYTGDETSLAALTGTDKLQDQLRQVLEGFEPFEVTVGPAVVGVHGVTLWSPPPAAAFTELVARCRAAIAHAWGDPLLAAAPTQPHISLGYGRTRGDSDPLIRAVKDVWAEPVTFTVDQVRLVAVTADPKAGHYTWVPTHTIELPPKTATAVVSVLWNDLPPGQMNRDLADELAVEEAEEAAAGVRRLTVLHDLRTDQPEELAALEEFVDGICTQHAIERFRTGAETYLMRTQPQTSWRFGPPAAAADLAIVRDALEGRYPHWPIEADNH